MLNAKVLEQFTGNNTHRLKPSSRQDGECERNTKSFRTKFRETDSLSDWQKVLQRDSPSDRQTDLQRDRQSIREAAK